MAKAKKYPKKKLKVFKQVLTERRIELLKQVTDQDDDIGELRDDQPADPLDMAGNSSTLELMTTLGNHERVELADIDHALAKIEEGTYGVCEVSGELIAEPRLMAIPTARYTIEVQAEREKTSPGQVERPRRRTVLSDDLPAMDEDS
ncbi:MAG: TraR/DksA C4-type zinc finger protein [Candidatus Latescibacterota bacterium]|nr:TraR/DksA C4-type zinc finger protein [Candidatus Latescibacterota bacterium]